MSVVSVHLVLNMDCTFLVSSAARLSALNAITGLWWTKDLSGLSGMVGLTAQIALEMRVRMMRSEKSVGVKGLKWCVVREERWPKVVFNHSSMS